MALFCELYSFESVSDRFACTMFFSVFLPFLNTALPVCYSISHIIYILWMLFTNPEVAISDLRGDLYKVQQRRILSVRGHLQSLYTHRLLDAHTLATCVRFDVRLPPSWAILLTRTFWNHLLNVIYFFINCLDHTKRRPLYVIYTLLSISGFSYREWFQTRRGLFRTDRWRGLALLILSKLKSPRSVIRAVDC